MAKADHICVERSNYWHHGIDVGDGSVIHYNGEKESKLYAKVVQTSMAGFLNGGRLRFIDYREPIFSKNKTIDLAQSRLGSGDYSLVFNNCEHFARQCKTGDAKSEQVKHRLHGTAFKIGVWTVAGALLAVGASPLLTLAVPLGIVCPATHLVLDKCEPSNLRPEAV